MPTRIPSRLLREGADKGGLKGVIHCFTATQYLADAALEMGFFISLSGIVTFKNAEALRQVAKTVPLDRLLVETDSPYLAPMPMRGKRNEPSFVRHTATYVAEHVRHSVRQNLRRAPRPISRPCSTRRRAPA